MAATIIFVSQHGCKVDLHAQLATNFQGCRTYKVEKYVQTYWNSLITLGRTAYNYPPADTPTHLKNEINVRSASLKIPNQRIR